MKRLLAVAVLVVAAAAIPAQADIGLTINLGEPGFFGRIDIGDFPAPQLINRTARTIQRVPTNRAPVYLLVPPGHAKHWKKHCHEYNACDQRVFFVSDEWYNREYVPRYREKHGHSGDMKHSERDGPGNDKGKGKDKDKGRDD